MKRPHVVALTLCIIAALASCSNPNPKDSAPALHSQPFPLANAIVTPQDSELDTWALLKYSNDCMGDLEGYLPDTFPDPRTQRYESLDEYGRRTLTEEVAKDWGYREALDDVGLSFRFALRSMHEDRSHTFDDAACAAKYYSEFGDLSRLQTVNFLLFKDPKPTSVLTIATQEWHKCIVSEGVKDATLDPRHMPTESMKSRFDTQTTPIDDEVVRPGKEEIAVAVADARCRVQSGYNAASYDAEWRKQEQILKDHREEVETTARELAEWRTRVGEYADAISE